MKKLTLIKDVFKTIGQPTINYVKRDKGKYELELKSAIQNKGTLSLLTGPSKTGKTSLFKKVIDDLALEALIVRCDDKLTSEELWKKALEKINFTRISQKIEEKDIEVSSILKGGMKFGWAWLAEAIGEVSIGIKGSTSESKIREQILAKPSPDHLIPVLKELPYILVVEDFHYLNNNVKKNIFQQWKTFIDNEVSVIVIGTTHHAVDIAFSNKDLIGRIVHIELNVWEREDLSNIVKLGFRHLNIELKSHLVKIIAEESVGLPIITQNTCLQLFEERGIIKLNRKNKNKIQFNKVEIFKALHKVAVTSYNSFKIIYGILSSGLRKKRKYNTYELLLLLFQKDPITFQLKRYEIDKRLENLDTNIDKPPASSINSTLSSLSKLQVNKNIELLEWSKTHQTLFILEPSFLFYLRWKDERDSQISFNEIMEFYETIFFKVSNGLINEKYNIKIKGFDRESNSGK